MSLCHFSVRNALAAACVLACAHLAAESAPVELDQVVVTATRTEQSLLETLASVSVIDRDEIERLQPLSVLDLLGSLPGIVLTNNGGPGKASALFLRGTESDHVVVLIDGVRIGSATFGGAMLQDVPVDQIERIEVVRGPFSSLYGSEAIGGVIQIFTRRPAGAFTPFASLGAGSDDLARASAGAAGRGEHGWYSASVAHERSDGIDATRCNPVFGSGCAPEERDRDGFRNASINLQGGYRFNAAWDAEARLYQARAHNENDAGVSDTDRALQRTLGTRLRYAPGDSASFTASLGRDSEGNTNYLHGEEASRFDNVRDLASLQADLKAGVGLLTLGYDWQRDRVISTTVYALDHRRNSGLFGQWQGRFGAHALQASLRRDDSSQFDAQVTGNLLWGWQLAQQLRLTASYGTAFKGPTFNELYYPGFGNPNLRPEHSRSAELGLRGTPVWGQWSLNAYVTRVDDLIGYDSSLVDDDHPWGQPNNIDTAHIRGAELSVGGTLAQWDWNASASWIDPRDAGSGATRDKLLPRRARQTARLELDRQWGRVSVGASAQFVSARYEDAANTQRMGGYTLYGLRAGYALGADWNLRLSLNNIADHRYETAQYFNQPGRSVLLTLNYRPSR